MTAAALRDTPAPEPLRGAGLLLQALAERPAETAHLALLPAGPVPTRDTAAKADTGSGAVLAPEPAHVQRTAPSGCSPAAGPPAPWCARPVLTDTALLLPAGLCGPLLRAALAHAAAHWRYSRPHQSAAGLKPMTLAVIGCLEDARVEHLLAQQFPGTRAWFVQAQRLHGPEGLGLTDLLARLSRALGDPAWNDPNPWVGRARGRVAELVAHAGWHDAAAWRRLGSILANELGQMRVRMAPDHVEPSLYRDDHSWLWQHEATSPQALSLEASEPAPGSGAHAADSTPPQAAAPHLSWYAEWHHRIGHLKPRWTTVHEYGQAIDSSSSANASYPSRLDQRRPRLVKRQTHGHALDLDACVRLRIAQAPQRLADRGMRPVAADHTGPASPRPPNSLASGGASDARLFLRHRPQPQPFSVLVLMDLSASMNDRVPRNGASPDASLLALAKRAGLALVRTARDLGGMAALHGFRADTRHAVHYERLLDFGATLDAAALARLQATPARHSTRLGSALRHATQHLLARPEARRLLLVLSDGAPSDVDVFDPHHLVEDARHAVQAARRAGVEVLCLSAHHPGVPGAAPAGAQLDERAAIARIFGRQAHGLGSLQAVQRMPQRLQALLIQALGAA